MPPRKRNDIYRSTTPAQGRVVQSLVDFADPRLGPDVIDIGCGYGEYMLSFKARGHKVAGVEPNESFAKTAQSKGLDVKVARGDSTGFTDKSFDTAVVFDVLQHVLDPAGLLKEAARLAKKNILVAVPNTGELDQLAAIGLTYEHLRDEDARNFYDVASLTEVCQTVPGATIKVARKEPLRLDDGLPGWGTFSLKAVEFLGLAKPHFYRRIYAEITLSQ